MSSPEPSTRQSAGGRLWIRRLGRVLAVLLLSWVTFESGGWLTLHYLDRAEGIRYSTVRSELRDLTSGALGDYFQPSGSTYLMHDRDLGWVPRPGASTELASLNSQGIRRNGEVGLQPPPGVLRVAAVGDSFTHGDEVGDEDTWCRRLESSSDQLEVLNFGVPAYGVDQSLLRYRSTVRKFHPDVVLIGYFPENICRHRNVLRPFYSRRGTLPLSKPRFRVEGDDLVLLPNPLRTREDYLRIADASPDVLSKLVEHEAYRRNLMLPIPGDFLPSVRLFRMTRRVLDAAGRSRGISRECRELYRDETARRLTLELLRTLYREAEADGAHPLILVFPDLQTLIRAKEGRPPHHQALLDDLSTGGLSYFDLTGSLLRENQEPLRSYFKRVHYSVKGNRAVAEAIGEELARRGLLPPGQWASR